MNLVSNGDFASGLDGWSTAGGVGVEQLAAGGFAARLAEPTSGLRTSLQQSIAIGPGVSLLAFTMEFETSSTTGGPSVFADAFAASVLYADTLDPVFSSTATDDFFYTDALGRTEFDASFIQFDAGRVVLDLESFGVVNRTLLLSFDLFGFDDGRASSARVSNVVMSAMTAPIPLPTPALLAACSLVGWVGVARRR